MNRPCKILTAGLLACIPGLISDLTLASDQYLYYPDRLTSNISENIEISYQYDGSGNLAQITSASEIEKIIVPVVNNSPAGTGRTYTRLAPLTAPSAANAGFYQPRFESPQAAWAKWIDMCGEVGKWEHEFKVNYDEERDFALRNLDGCIHVKGILGPKGEKPYVTMGATKAYKGMLRSGGVFIENVRLSKIDVPGDQHFIIAHNVEVAEWASHAIITPSRGKHLYVEILDSTFEGGNSQHALYIDNNAFANIQRNVIQSPGPGHALRSVAQKAIIKDNVICNIQCDGKITKNNKGIDRIGAPPVDIYVNGETLFEGNRVVYYRKDKGDSEHVATFRARPHIQTLDRISAGDYYQPLIWGTEHYNDPATWHFPMIESVVKDMEIECLGLQPCVGWMVRSTYPRAPQYEAVKPLRDWLMQNKFSSWDQVLAYSDPSWHATLNLMTDEYKARLLKNEGRGLPFNMPLAVPEGWQQKAKITFENVTGNIAGIYKKDPHKNWCQGKTDGVSCLDEDYYGLPEIVMGKNTAAGNKVTEETFLERPVPTADWQQALLPHMPEIGEIRRIPNTELTPVLLPDDDSPACKYLNCKASKFAISSWSGISFDNKRGIVRLIAPGGHGTLGANSVYEFNIGSLFWRRVYDYGKLANPFPNLIDADGDGFDDCVGFEDGPMGVHNYDGLVYIPTIQASLMVKTTFYDPRNFSGRDRCRWNGPQPNDLYIWKDSGGYEKIPLTESGAYTRAVYDPQRDKVYMVAAFPNNLWEIDPHTWERRVLAKNIKAGSGGAMTIRDREIYWSALNSGLYRATISLSGRVSHIERLVRFPEWFDRDGLAITEDKAIGWNGMNQITTYDLVTGKLEKTAVPGDDLSSDNMRVYGKWFEAMPRVFLGITSNEGWVIYRHH